ncbi:sugar transferase [Streptococcus sp. IMAU 99125]|jgi:O-antigen biosynthesis protein WbqP|uniref:Sugar transferase n=1 Tax=Streptococcus humanilactis TaxID=2841061 RepID=A0ABS7DWH4_9STRE|nr:MULTISPECIES: sugar transferase [Streptococcus]MBW7580488.1 sugar transferase [Streptococcus humanilactis]MBW7582349.1 sugar transferase [Streptococcus humanilactis]TMR79551.1 sugar transferase [Streptococcus pseudopneumoniae]UGZ04878.1 putative initial sugar transferase [Streptococcus mitis]
MYSIIKRLGDITLSLIGIIILCPVFMIIAIAIKLDSEGPIIFKQKRFGIHKEYFYIFKFRSMKIDAPKNMAPRNLHNPEQWITKVGAFLRKTSLDELPQLFNILIGDMSIVGPRPAGINELDVIAERDKYGANDVLPGLTGWAQINGRDTLSVEMKTELDGYYVKHLSLRMDVRCIVKTIPYVLKRKGIVEGSGKKES